MSTNERDMSSTSVLESLFLALPSLSNQHAPDSKLYDLLKKVARREVENLFCDSDEQVREFKPFGELVLAYHKMGVMDSLNLFDLDEFIIFSFYWTNRKSYSAP